MLHRPVRPVPAASVFGAAPGHPPIDLAVGVRLLATIGVAVAAVGTALVVAMVNQPYFDLLNGVVDAQDAIPRALVFSSWPVLVAAPFVLWRPAWIGFRLGDTVAEWRVVAAACAVGAVATAAILRVTGRIPYSDASLVVESVIVPVSEELLFRGVALAILIAVLARLYRTSTAIALAVVLDGVAFGLAHLANATSLDLGFVAPQAAFAIVLGTACGWLAIRTRSVVPAMLLHAAVNAVVVLV
jgi:membrane protease YdiL (CAAX protease family)